MRSVKTVLVLVAALLLAGCGGGGLTVTDQPTALDATVESFAGSWSWTGRVEVSTTDEAIAAIAERQARDRDWQDVAEAEEDVREGLEWMERAHGHGALAEDGTFQGAGALDDVDVFDFRTDFRDLFSGATLEPELAFLIRFDWDAVRTMLVDFAGVDGEEFDEGRAEARSEASEALADEPDVLAVAEAIIDGEFGGVAGTVDLRAFGVAEEDLGALREHFANEMIGEAGREQMRELLDEAVTVRDFRTEDGVSVATLDVHPRAAAFAVYDLFDDAEDIAQDLAGSRAAAEELPETLTDVATLRFEDGWLTEVRTDVVAIARQLVEAGLVEDPELGELMEIAGDTSMEVVFTFADHGEIDTVTDVDATTMAWDDVFETFFGGAIDDALDG